MAEVQGVRDREFVVTGFQELGEGRLEALCVAEEVEGQLHPVGQVRFGFAGRGLWAELDARRAGAAVKGVVPIESFMAAKIKFFGRYKGGTIRDSVLLSIERRSDRNRQARNGLPNVLAALGEC